MISHDMPATIRVLDRMGRSVRAGLRRGLDLILPPRCLGCGVDVDRAGTLCARCWQGIDFIAPPLCACCGLPFDVSMPGDAPLLCPACIARPPAFDRCRSVFRYDAASRGLVLAFKHADRTDAAPGFAGWLARAGADLLETADLLVPVPLHRWRLFHRRYNQAALLTLELARLTGRTAAPDLLLRRRDTGTQGGRSRGGRARNVAGAFTVSPRWAARLRGARVLLLDDVFTTGATVEACSTALKRGGAAAVDVLTLARVVRPVALVARDG